jgi:hypothetical protein
MIKETYIKPEVKSEILEAEVLHLNFGSPAGGNGGGGNGGGYQCPPGWHC